MSAPYPWQDRQWQGLQEAHRANRLPHALLLHGPPGAGVSDFVHRFAASMLCEDPVVHGTPCGTCRSCLLYQSDNHPDLCVIEPEEEGKPMKVDQIRELVQFVGLTGHYGQHKIAILDPAEAMNASAANGLLVTLEEPPPHNLIMLVSHQPTRLPITVRSRCQRITMQVPPLLARHWLAERSVDDPDTLLALTDNAPLVALECADGHFACQRLEIVTDLEQLTFDAPDPITLAEKWTKIGARQVVRWLLRLLQDILRLKFVQEPPLLANRDLVERLHELAKRLDLQALFGSYDRLIEYQELIGSNANVNVHNLMEEFTIKWISQFDDGENI